MPLKTLGLLGKIRVGRVTGNTHIFFCLSTKIYGEIIAWVLSIMNLMKAFIMNKVNYIL